ncbi:hypothetical protein [Caenispirillum bisanense]|uniref:hypothetical protein n=1 Tax=Caenispirillum bisanense TaxID=414052 RepID=UPI0031D462D0
MRSSITMMLATAAACALLVGGEVTAFAWFLDLMATGYLDLSMATFRLLALVGIGLGLAAFGWTAVRVFRIEQKLAAEPPQA